MAARRTNLIILIRIFDRDYPSASSPLPPLHLHRIHTSLSRYLSIDSFNASPINCFYQQRKNSLTTFVGMEAQSFWLTVDHQSRTNLRRLMCCEDAKMIIDRETRTMKMLMINHAGIFAKDERKMCSHKETKQTQPNEKIPCHGNSFGKVFSPILANDKSKSHTNYNKCMGSMRRKSVEWRGEKEISGKMKRRQNSVKWNRDKYKFDDDIVVWNEVRRARWKKNFINFEPSFFMCSFHSGLTFVNMVGLGEKMRDIRNEGTQKRCQMPANFSVRTQYINNMEKFYYLNFWFVNFV